MKLSPLFISTSIPTEQEAFLNHHLRCLRFYLDSEINKSNFTSKQLARFQKKYQQSHRQYHNLSHLISIFRLAEQVDIEDRRAFEVAVWFHDIIYQPYFKNNEARSAIFFRKALKKQVFHKLSLTEIRWIEQAILSTHGHQPKIKGNRDLKLFLDMDLAVLASDAPVYDTYTKAIRKEYWIYPTSMYNKGRIKVLTHFLEREIIYFTEEFKDFEAQARGNIKREIKVLTQ